MSESQSKNVHVVPRNGQWAVRREGNSRATSTHDTQREAIEHARVIARSCSSGLVIHRADGRVRERHSDGRAPFPPKEARTVLDPVTPSVIGAKKIKEAVREVIKDKQSKK